MDPGKSSVGDSGALPMERRIELAREGYVWGRDNPGFTLDDIRGWPADKWCAAMASEMERVPLSEADGEEPWLDKDCMRRALAKFLAGAADRLPEMPILQGPLSSVDPDQCAFVAALPWILAGNALASLAAGCDESLRLTRFFSTIYAMDDDGCSLRGVMVNAFCVKKIPGDLREEQALASLESFKLDAAAAAQARPLAKKRGQL